MSTNPDDLAPPPADDGAPPPNPDPPPVDDPPQDTGEDSPYAPLAKDLGWTPRDKYDGPPEQWKDAETFIRDGREIQRDTAAQLKSVRTTLDNLTRTSASLVEQQVNERVEALREQHAKAVEDGDTDTALRLAGQITTTLETTKTAPAPSSEAQAFAERNASWFQKPGNEYATARAIEICNTLAGQGYKDHGTQLRIAEQRLRQEMPQLFKQDMNGTRKDPPGVNAPGSRGAAPSNRQKGFADMPAEAQKIARDMKDRGVIKSEDDYVKNYFANIAGKA
jgi:hypothetical protein